MQARKFVLMIPLVLAALLSACATPPKAVEEEAQKATIETSMEEATTAQKAGQPERALTILKAAAANFPADKQPWLRIAQMKFDTANYGEAIMNALEALQRDPTNNIANSIVAVSGLRLATKSLSDLRTQNALSGSVKTEAQDLAKLLRENLGESVLVPPAVNSVVHAPVRPHHIVATKKVKAVTVGIAAPTAIPPAEVKPAAPSDSGKPNPFGGLK